SKVERILPVEAERMTMCPWGLDVESATASLSMAAIRSPAGLSATDEYSWSVAAAADVESSAPKTATIQKRIRKTLPRAESRLSNAIGPTGPGSATSVSAGDSEFGGFDQRRLRLARREHREAVDRPARIVPRALDRISKCIGLTEQSDGVGEISVRRALAANSCPPEGAVLGIPASVGKNDRKGHLAVAEVVADVLAHHRFVRRIVDHVVAELEGDAEVPAVAFQRQLRVLARFGNYGRHPAGGGEQGRGLRADDVEILIFVSVDLALGGELVDLALGDHRGGVAENLEHLQAAVLDHQLECSGKEEVADQNARRIAPDEIRRSLAPAHSRAVDDIVVEKRRCMNELDRSGELVMASAWIAEQGAAAEGQHRPHPLAAAGDEMAGKLRDQRDLALHP